MAQIFDTIIIGAGWAGAVAARELATAGRSVLVLEARDRAGGRARTWASGNARIDLGCSWIHGYNEGNPARGIASSLGVAAHIPKPLPGAIYGPDGPLSPEDGAKLGAALAAAQAAARTPYPAPAPTASLADSLFAANSPLAQLGDLGRGFARTLEVPLGVTLEQASARWAGWEAATNFSGSDAAPAGGFQGVVERVLQQAVEAGATVRLGTQVLGISDSNEVVGVRTETEEFAARTVISTIPLGVLKTLPVGFFAPPLPPRLADIVTGTHVGVLEKAVLSYPRTWWPRPEAVGSYVFLPTSSISPSESSSIDEILSAATLVTANLAAPSLPGGTPALLTYISETPARLLLTRPEDEVLAGLHAFLVKRFGITDTVPQPEEGVFTMWLRDPLARGATTTPSIVSNGERSPMDFKELSRPIWDGRLGFAGEHTEMDNRGSVAGAVISGQREAARVERWLAKNKRG